MTTLLITGASGFIGRNLAGQLRCDYDVTAPSHSELDLCDEEAVRQLFDSRRFDMVLHCATVHSNRKVQAPPDLLQRNCRMFFNLASNSARYGKMLYFGSAAEYDSRHHRPLMREDYFGTHVPLDDYGFSKYICAQSACAFHNLYELRLFAVFGPYESWEVRFLSNACCRAMWDLPIAIRQNVFFDFLDVLDLARIVEWFISHTLRHKHYNVCSGRAYDLNTLAAKVRAASGKALDIVVKREGLGREYSGDNSRLTEEMGDFKFSEIDTSISRLYQWYLERKDAIDPALLDFDS